eukprot:scaffold249_cov132-Isochrysis_galbana.AAC.4
MHCFLHPFRQSPDTHRLVEGGRHHQGGVAGFCDRKSSHRQGVCSPGAEGARRGSGGFGCAQKPGKRPHVDDCVLARREEEAVGACPRECGHRPEVAVPRVEKLARRNLPQVQLA